MNHPESIACRKLPAEETALADQLAGVCAYPAKRFYDLALSALGLVVLSPLLLLIAALIKISDGGKVLYRQSRVGFHGRPFVIFKFRTMVSRSAESGPLVTGDGDVRITGLGRILRKTKLDELPQLWNVLKGEMSLVGPRPEVPRFVQQYTPAQRNILRLKPGVTDLASIHFRNEEMLLRNSEQMEEFYVRHCVPRKLQLNLEYARRANLVSDTWIILQTVCPYWICLLLVYFLVLAGAFWLSCQLVYDFALPRDLLQSFGAAMLSVVAVQLGALIWRRQCKGLLSYFSLPELKQILWALGFACFVLLGLWTLTGGGPGRNLILVDALVSLCALSGFRLLLRFWRESSAAPEDGEDSPAVRVGIIGAGSTGSQVARQLAAGKRFGRTVLAFFDDDSRKWHRYIHEIPVVGMPECLLDSWAGRLDEVIIALPDAPLNRVREVGELIRQTGLTAYTASSMFELRPGNGGHGRKVAGTDS